VRKVDAESGQVLATVRTRTPIRAFGPAHSRDTIFCVAEKRLLVHDATTLERVAEYRARFPRYSNAIRAIDPNTVALAAPKALVEYDLPTGKTRRPLPAPAIALETIGGRVVAMLADGAVMARTQEWTRIGSFPQPQYTGCIDEEAGWLVSLAGQRPTPHDETGNPQAYQWPRSRELHAASAFGEWTPRVINLPFAADTIGVIGGRMVAVQATGDSSLVASRDFDEPEESWNVDPIPGSFAGFAGRRGLIISSGPAPISLSLFVQA
jgi:hypothetical protein